GLPGWGELLGIALLLRRVCTRLAKVSDRSDAASWLAVRDCGEAGSRRTNGSQFFPLTRSICVERPKVCIAPATVSFHSLALHGSDFRCDDRSAARTAQARCNVG